MWEASPVYGEEDVTESTADVAALLDLIVDEGGVLLTATGADGQWTLRLRFLDRKTISRVYERLVDRGLTVDLDRIHNLQDDPAARIGLTDEQYEALSTAISHGYFKIPRNISLEELAAECGISHQAMSERLRRAFEVLATTELNATPDSEGRGSE